jgi:hypothetical protein
MGPLIKGVILGLAGVVVFAPLVLLLAVLGIPILAAGAAVLGILIAIPLIIFAALTLPVLLVGALVVIAIAVALVTAVKVALFVVLPMALVALAIGWLVKTNQAHRAELGS